MKTTQVLACSLAVGSMIFAAGKASAVPMKLNVSGTFTYQLADSMSGSGMVTTSKTKTVTFNNNSIIAALNASAVFTTAAGGLIPKGSYLVMDDNNTSSIIVTNKSGFSRDLTALPYYDVYGYPTGFASFSYSSDEVKVYSGKYNSSTYQGSKNGLSITESLFITDGAGSTINIKGLVKNSNSASNVNRTSGLQNVTSSGSITGVGAGSYQGYPAVVQGKGTASGN